MRSSAAQSHTAPPPRSQGYDRTPLGPSASAAASLRGAHRDLCFCSLGGHLLHRARGVWGRCGVYNRPGLPVSAQTQKVCSVKASVSVSVRALI